MWRKAVAAGAMLLLGVAVFRYVFPRTPRIGPLARWEPKPGRLVLIVPHSDDEVLAAGGLLQAAEARGEKPLVVLVTGGDAFKVAAETHYQKLHVGPEEMLAFGRHRLGESRAALAALGLPPDRLVFLGYPDQGLPKLWMECWAAPCAGHLTGAQSVPYSEARTPGAPYTGMQLVQELKEVLREARPSVLAFPHPNEAHVDHWALSNFVTAALADLSRTEPGWTPPEEWLYLVHRGDWPAPKGYRPTDQLLPPEKMAVDMTTWRLHPLTPEQVQRKKEALDQYRSQTAVLRRYMFSFVRTNELFGQLTPVQPARQGAGSMPGAPPWPGPNWVQLVQDPRGDTLARELEQGADVVSLWGAAHEGTLHLAAETAAPLRHPAQARLYVRGFRAGHGWGEVAQVAVQPDQAGGAWLRAALPLARLGAPLAVMVNIETRVDSILIDRSAWRLLPLDGR